MSLIVILGPTAVGKTKLAVKLTGLTDGEIISADSRQVYKGMDIGTGKDLADFSVDGKSVPYHLIDIKEAGEEYHVFDFQQDFYEAYETVRKNGKQPILCGGTGMYLEAALAEEKMLRVPVDEELRKELELHSQKELSERLMKLKPDLHNTTDLTEKERSIRAIEIEVFKQSQNTVNEKSPVTEKIIFGIRMEREQLRARIEDRLKTRLEEGMVDEVRELMSKGISVEKLNYYGLEYRFISLYLTGQINYEEMYEKLLQAIRRFAKKQMTWYRRMEKRGTLIYWIDAELPMNEKIEFIRGKLKDKTNFT